MEDWAKGERLVQSEFHAEQVVRSRMINCTVQGLNGMGE